MRSNDLRMSEIASNPEAQEILSGIMNQDLDILGGEAEAVLDGEVPIVEVINEKLERVLGNSEISTLPTSVPEDIYTAAFTEMRNEIAQAMVDPNLPSELQRFADTLFELIVEQAAVFDINTYDIEYIGQTLDKLDLTDLDTFAYVMRDHPEACGL